MIPLKDENPSRTIPFVNFFLILANCAAFIYLKYYSPLNAQQIFLRLGFIPYEISYLVDINPKDLVPIPLTIFTSMFVHGGWLHLLSNMLYLWIFGDNIEDRLGHIRYFGFYMMSGVFAAVVHACVNLNSTIPTVGASGAVAGVLGAYLLLFPGVRIHTLFIIFIFVRIIKLPALLVLCLWITMQILSALTEYNLQDRGGIAWFAHIGGFISGLILVTVMKKRKRRVNRK